MADVTGFGLDISGFNASIKQAEESFNRLKRTGVATAQAINKAFADASNGGIQQMRQSLDNMFGALSKNGGAQKSVEKIGQAVTNVGTQAARSATGIDALIRSIAMGGSAYSDLMAKINRTDGYNRKNGQLAAIDQQLEEQKAKLKELRDFLLNPEFDGKTFVEASPYDKIWGVRIDENDPMIDDEKNEVVVVDYKFGEYTDEAHAKYQRQVGSYVRLIEEMGYDARGYLLYATERKLFDLK